MRTFVSLSLAAIAALTVATATAGTVRSALNGRTWQTVYDPSEPLSWPWPDGATSARIAFSNETTGAVCESAAVARGDGDAYGTFAVVLPADWTDGREALVSATLTVSGAGGVLESYDARLAYLPAQFTVFKPGTRKWMRSKGERIGSYDAAWLAETADEESAMLTVTPPAASVFTMPLDGTSGYFPVAESTMLAGGGFGDVNLSLGFGSESDAWLATVGIYGSGLLLFIR